MIVEVTYPLDREERPKVDELIEALEELGHEVHFVEVSSASDDYYLNKLSYLRHAKQYYCAEPGCNRIGDKLAAPGNPKPYRCPEHR